MPRFELTYDTSADTDLVDITDDIARCVRESGVQDGVAVCFTPGSTAALTTIEYESGALRDLHEALERIAPAESHYHHNARWHDGNGYARLRSALMGPSLSLVISGGQPELGTWQQLLLCDFDNKARRRRVLVRVVADGDA